MSTQPPADPTPRRYWTAGKMLIAAGALVGTAFVSCITGAAIGSSSKQAVSAPPAGGAVAAPTSRPTAASTPAPTAPPLFSSAPINSEGTGSKVVDLDLPVGRYKFSWRVEAPQFDNFIVRLEGADTSFLVNELVGSSSFSSNNPSSGEAFIRLGGGHYQLVVKTSTTKWWTTFTPL